MKTHIISCEQMRDGKQAWIATSLSPVRGTISYKMVPHRRQATPMEKDVAERHCVILRGRYMAYTFQPHIIDFTVSPEDSAHKLRT